MRGGYLPSGHTDLDHWDPAAFPTILSGDLLGNDGFPFLNREDNSYHVVSAGGATADFEDFLRVLASDTVAARAALKVVLSRPGISSQLVDNLNVSTHLRAVLTDLFLLDEAVKSLR